MPRLARYSRTQWPLLERYRPMFWGERLLARMLFYFCLTLAIGMGLLLVLAPWMPLRTQDDFAGRTYQLFASDAIVRRTAVVSALGLCVTAAVFFYVPGRFRYRGQRRSD